MEWHKTKTKWGARTLLYQGLQKRNKIVGASAHVTAQCRMVSQGVSMAVCADDSGGMRYNVHAHNNTTR